MKTLKYQFLATAIAITFFLVILGFFTNLSFQRTQKYYQLIQSIERLDLLKASIARAEKDFLLHESVNPRYFETGESQFISTIDSLHTTNILLLNQLASNRIISNLDLHKELLVLKSHFISIDSLFKRISQSLYEYGYENHGLSGEMRTYIHRVERTLQDENHYELTAMMLTLRRHEKDFMLRKDTRYLDRFENTFEAFIARMQQLGVNHGLIPMVQDYRLAFLELARKDMEIGTITSDGLLYRINKELKDADPVLQNIRDIVVDHSQMQISIYLWIILLAFLVLPVSIIIVYYRLSDKIVRQLKSLKTYLGRLGRGELPDQINHSGKDEISQMIDSINNLTENLRNTRNFAIEVGKGNFQTEINVFGNQGDLGGSLIQMKNQLEEVAKKQEIQKEEERQRNWAAEGSALFASILRQNNDDLSKMIDLLVVNLVKYIGANQVGIFLVQDNENEKYFELVGCYAYDRKKYLQKRIEWGEGLIGACAMEKDSIYLTQLPKDYIRITSGLGDTPPDYIFILPLIHEEKVFGVIEMAGFKEMEPFKRDFCTQVSGSIASQISILKSNIQKADLLRQSDELAWNLKQQEEELKQNMEEMQAAREESDRLIEKLRRELAAKKNLIPVLS